MKDWKEKAIERLEKQGFIRDPDEALGGKEDCVYSKYYRTNGKSKELFWCDVKLSRHSDEVVYTVEMTNSSFINLPIISHSETKPDDIMDGVTKAFKEACFGPLSAYAETASAIAMMGADVA